MDSINNPGILPAFIRALGAVGTVTCLQCTPDGTACNVCVGADVWSCSQSGTTYTVTRPDGQSQQGTSLTVVTTAAKSLPPL